MALVIGAFTCASAGQVPCSYEVSHTILGPPCPGGGSSVTIANGISPNGRYVVGFFRLCAIGEDQAFIFDTTTTQFSLIPLPSGFYAAVAADVNDAGIVVGTALRTNIGQRGFVYNLHTGGWTELLPLPGGVCSGATAVNANNVVCGWRSIGPGTQPTTAYRWNEKTGFEDLGLINSQSTTAADIANDNTVAGRMNISNVLRPYLWHEDGSIDDLGTLFGAQTTPNAMNYRHDVVGAATVPMTSPTQARAFLFNDGSMADLGVLPGYSFSTATDISDDGILIGRSSVAGQSNPTAATIWINGQNRDLNSIVTSRNSAQIVTPHAISHNARIAGEAITAQGVTIGIVLAPIFSSLADITRDCRVGVPDLLAIINEWGQTESRADINQDDVVDVDDLLMVIRDWTID